MNTGGADIPTSVFMGPGLRRDDGQGSGLIQPDQQFLEHVERAQFAVHRERFAQGVADAGMDGRRRDFHEAPGGSMNHGF